MTQRVNEMNMQEFERKARCVATAWEALEGQEGWENVVKKFDLGFPYAWLVHMKHGTLNNRRQGTSYCNL